MVRANTRDKVVVIYSEMSDFVSIEVVRGDAISHMEYPTEEAVEVCAQQKYRCDEVMWISGPKEYVDPIVAGLTESEPEVVQDPVVRSHILPMGPDGPMGVEITGSEVGTGGAMTSYTIGVPTYNYSHLLTIYFQKGDPREGWNGVTNEELLAIVEHRLEGFQAGKFRCRENAIALTKIQEALMWLQRRTMDRLRRGVEGQQKT